MTEAGRTADAARRALGFLSQEETVALEQRGIIMPEPSSVLISPMVMIGAGSVIWPNVVLQVSGSGRIAIGEKAILHSSTQIVASGGTVEIGAEAEIGEEGGFTIKAEAGENISVGDGARLLGGGSLMSTNRIGRGAQILGPIRCQNCTLGDGGTYKHPEPDERGGVLKGSGVARNLSVPQGHVIQAFGLFAEGVMRRQSFFHPKADRA